jgi:hypothetical protein
MQARQLPIWHQYCADFTNCAVKGAFTQLKQWRKVDTLIFRPLTVVFHIAFDLAAMVLLVKLEEQITPAIAIHQGFVVSFALIFQMDWC